MKILGFNFTKLNAEKLSNKMEGVKINTNIDISDIKKVKSDFFETKQKILGIKFTNTITYDPDFAKIELSGNALISVDENTFEQVLKDWEKKSMPEEFRLAVFNLILRKSSLKALQLEEELNIPLHMPMPSLRAPDSKQVPAPSFDEGQDKKEKS